MQPDPLIRTENSDDLLTGWECPRSPVTVTADSNGLFQFTDSSGSPKRFYRARALPELKFGPLPDKTMTAKRRH